MKKLGIQSMIRKKKKKMYEITDEASLRYAIKITYAFTTKNEHRTDTIVKHHQKYDRKHRFLTYQQNILFPKTNE